MDYNMRTELVDDPIADFMYQMIPHTLCGNQSFEAAPFRGKLMLFRQRFPNARRGGAERVRLVQAGAESVTTRPT